MDIAVVGGGCSALLLLLNLLPQITHAGDKLLVFSDEEQFGRGIAYGTDNALHLLNVPAGNMSAYPDEPQHFLQFCQRRDANITANSFVPRRLYGDYLQDCLSHTLQRYPNRMQRINARVVSIKPNANNFTLMTNQRESYSAADVVLALGHFNKNSHYQALVAESSANKINIGNSWAAADIAACNGADDVLLIGSGHTAMDAVLALQQLPKPPKVQLISRRGLLAQAHRAQAPTQINTLGANLLQTVAPTARNYLRQLRALIKNYQRDGGDWRDIIGGLRAQTPALWQRLPQQEQARFLRHLWPYWDIHRHRLAPQVAVTVAELLQQQQLKVQADRLARVTACGQRIAVTIRARGKESSQTVMVDRIIDCTGPNYTLHKINDPLIQQLLSNGYLQQDALGMGLIANSSYQLSASQCVTKPLRYLGPMLRSHYLEAVGVTELRQHAHKLAAQLIQAIAVEHKSATAEVPTARFTAPPLSPV